MQIWSLLYRGDDGNVIRITIIDAIDSRNANEDRNIANIKDSNRDNIEVSIEKSTSDTSILYMLL